MEKGLLCASKSIMIYLSPKIVYEDSLTIVKEQPIEINLYLSAYGSI